MAKTSIIRGNGVRDSTETRVADNFAAEFAKRLVQAEKEARQSKDNELSGRIDALDERLNSEISARNEAENDIRNTISAEVRRLEDADDILRQRIEAEETERISADNILRQNIEAEMSARASAISAEETARKAADDILRQNIEAEASARRAADDTLYTNIDREAAARMTADKVHTEAIAEHEERISELEEQAHTHDNKDLLDGITAEQVEKWDANSEDGFKEFVMKTFYNLYGELQLMYSAISINVYDGGYVSMTEINRVIDGGDVNDTEINRTIEGDDLSETRDFTNFAAPEEIIAAWNREE